MLNSVFAQTTKKYVSVEVLICLDRGEKLAEKLDFPNVKIVNSDGQSQAKALNAGISKACKRHIAFLEDDDFWLPSFLSVCKNVFKNTDNAFVSSNQTEITVDGEVLGVNDFPTPSGWVFDRMKVGGEIFFDENYKWHLDNEFLGQLNKRKVRRAHLVDSYAPIQLDIAMRSRVTLGRMVANSKTSLQLIRHNSFIPLVTKTIHPGSGMAYIAKDKNANSRSQFERKMLHTTYGCIPE
jgi:glycosyltransferase involved in cell wall biosynthesis